MIKTFYAFLQAKTNHSYTKQSILNLLQTNDKEILMSLPATG